MGPSVFAEDCGHMERANVAVALDQREHSLLRRGLAMGAVLGFAADIGFVGFHHLVLTAKRRKIGRGLQRLANAMAKKPNRLVRLADHAADLKGTHSFL